MEKMSKCQIADCGNKASYFHEGFKIKICTDHSHQNKQENCTRLRNIGESGEALEVIGACMKSMLVEIETEGNFLDFEEQSFVATRIQKKIVQLIPQLESIKDKSLFQDIKIIEKGIVGIMKELHQSDCFKQFCMRNYMALMCNYLKIDYNKVSRLIKTPFDDDGIQAKLQRVEEEAETLKHDLKKLRERVITTIGLEPQANFQKAYELITNKKLIPSDPKELSFDCACPKDACFMESSDGNVLFNCKELNICRITDNIKLAKDFICSSFPQTVQNFHMNLNGGILDCEEVNDIIVYVSPHVSKEFCIYGMEMSHFQMKNILQTLCKNQRKVGFGYCKLELDSIPSIGYCLNKSIIEDLNLGGCGYSQFSDWENHPERFTNLIKGLSLSKDFIKNLKSIHMEKCGIEEDIVRGVLDKYGFQYVSIEQYSI